MNEKYVFLLHALCAAASNVVPSRVAGQNITIDAFPSGCSLPFQRNGNGCAAYTLATICGAMSRYLCKGEYRNKDRDVIEMLSMMPFNAACFDGEGEEKGRAVLAYLAMLRLYQFGEFFEWTELPQRGRTLMVKYKKWEEHQSIVLDSVEDIAVRDITFKGTLPLEIVTDVNEINPSGCGTSGKEPGISLSKSFIHILAGGIRKYSPELHSATRSQACRFLQKPRYCRGLKRTETSPKVSKKLRRSYRAYGVWRCFHEKQTVTEEKQKCFTSLKVSSSFRAKSVDVELHVRPPYNISQTLLPNARADGTFNINDLVGP
jgi:hypothetical protein